jgi:histidyl-tRNA synthetase
LQKANLPRETAYMKPSIPKGTRDFLPQQVNRRNYIFDIIRRVFIKYGYQAIETPVMENLSTLTGKYGEEGDRLLFKVLNNGDFLNKADEAALRERDSNKLIPSIAKRGLRYDLTVPFARFVVMYQNDLAFPFKRYQIQPVWRADRPQKGRYQEFYQCDVDVVGSESLSYEAELVQIYDEVFAQLGVKAVIRINNRKILAGIAEVAGIPEQMVDMTVAIDKLDKIGIEGVRKELTERGIGAPAIATIENILAIQTLPELKKALADSLTGLLGVTEIATVMDYLQGYPLTNTLHFDITLARGLSYYTGCIFEVNVDTTAHPDVKMGSIGGGGRYADLTSVFGMRDMPGVGVSFGAERIYDVLEELQLFPAQDAAALQVLLIAFDVASHRYAFRCLNQLRAAGINADLYPDPVKLKKQMKYADDRQVPYVVIIGDNEMNSGQLSFKTMANGQQEQLTVAEIIARF